MRTIINLSNPKKSPLEYKISQFPDGQRDIELEPSFGIIPKHAAEIRSHFRSFQDLELIVATNKILQNAGIKDIRLFIPYLLGARSDRRFKTMGSSYLVDVIAPIINAQNFSKVLVWDAHSDVAAACIKNLDSASNDELVKKALDRLCLKTEDIILISPDGGSLKKIYKVAEHLKYNGDIITCSKSRDADGKLRKTVVPMASNWSSEKAAVIIDDICDGGRTFINIAKEMKDNDYKGDIYLIVTHGIFSAGFEELNKYFKKIVCTNSYKEISNELIVQIPVI